MQCNTPVGSEVLNVVLAANITPDRQDDTQLLQAINALIAGGDSGGGNSGNVGGSGAEIGSVTSFAMPIPPEGWLVCDGSEVSRTDYAGLFATIGTIWGAGDEVSTFNLPDLRGEFIRGFDAGRNIDNERLFASLQGDAIRNIKATVAANTNVDGRLSGAFSLTTDLSGENGIAYGTGQGGLLNFDASAVVPTADENRPRNIAMTYAIKAFYPVATSD